MVQGVPRQTAAGVLWQERGARALCRMARCMQRRSTAGPSLGGGAALMCWAISLTSSPTWAMLPASSGRRSARRAIVVSTYTLWRSGQHALLGRWMPSFLCALACPRSQQSSGHAAFASARQSCMGRGATGLSWQGPLLQRVQLRLLLAVAARRAPPADAPRLAVGQGGPDPRSVGATCSSAPAGVREEDSP